jgi:glucokinase
MVDACLLIGDIGGTNARFALALADESGFTHELTLSCAEYTSANQAIATYLDRVGAGAPDVICLACAGPVMGGAVNIINNHWAIDSAELNAEYPSAKVVLLNDFEAISYSVPALVESDLMNVGTEPSRLPAGADFTIAVLGPGTGLGIGGLLGRQGRVYPVAGEGGHVGFAPETPVQHKVLRQLRRDFERVSNERMLCGPGLENIYRALCRIAGKAETGVSAAEIFSRVLASEDTVASDAVAMFFEALGQVAGDLVLTLGAYDGVFLAGGILKRYPDLLKASDFRAGFEAKGRHRNLMEKVPLSLILHPQPGLLGASLCARDALGRK